MNYVGVDIHKKYSVLCALDESGRKLREGRVEGNQASGFAKFFAGLEGPSKAVVEACWNWGLIHDELEELEQVEEVILAHPHKTRLIAEAQIKTDRLDAHALGTLLRGNLVARAHVPSQATRARKNLLRQRLYWARLRTMLRNRVHALLDRQRHLELPQCGDIFGRRALSFLRRVELPEPDATLLKEQLVLHELITQQMKAQAAAAKSATVRFFTFATNGCAGRWLKPAGSRSAVRLTLVRFTNSTAPAARKPTARS